MTDPAITKWLLRGDVSIQFQTHRDVLGLVRHDLQSRIAKEGWGKRYIASRGSDGHWGRGFYQPKWTSTHYTLLDLRTLEIDPAYKGIQDILIRVVEQEKGADGGINPAGSVQRSDVCINGMFLNYACYFQTPEERLITVIDFILHQRMRDGGFNCRLNRSGAIHSSMHSTLSIMEGIHAYMSHGYSYRATELQDTYRGCLEFLLQHRLFRSDRTGQVIHPEFLRFSFPGRWKYNILRALDHLREAEVPYDDRMSQALEVI